MYRHWSSRHQNPGGTRCSLFPDPPPATSQCATLSCQVTRPLKMQCIRAACALHHLPPTRSSLSSCSHRSPMCRILRTGWSVQARYNLVCLCLCVLHHCITVDNVPFIHSKSERVCGFWFSVSTNLQKKSVNLNDKITRQKCVNQWKVLQMHHLKAKCQKIWNKKIGGFYARLFNIHWPFL